MLSGTIELEDLRRVVYNLLLYSHKDTTVQGKTLWVFDKYYLSATAYDDYFALTDIVEQVGQSSEMYFIMELKDLKLLDTWLKDPEKFSQFFDGDAFRIEELILYPTTEASEPELFRVQEKTLGLGKMSSLSELAISPDRLRKLSWIKPGGYPIDMKVFNDDGEKYIAFKAGPTVVGAIAPLNRDTLKELYTNEEIWL